MVDHYPDGHNVGLGMVEDSPQEREIERLRNDLKSVRQAVADYMSSEGCACCRNIEAHERHAAALGKLLRVPKYKDGSGHDFGRFKTKHSNGACSDGK